MQPPLMPTNRAHVLVHFLCHSRNSVLPSHGKKSLTNNSFSHMQTHCHSHHAIIFFILYAMFSINSHWRVFRTSTLRPISNLMRQHQATTAKTHTCALIIQFVIYSNGWRKMKILKTKFKIPCRLQARFSTEYCFPEIFLVEEIFSLTCNSGALDTFSHDRLLESYWMSSHYSASLLGLLAKIKV